MPSSPKDAEKTTVAGTAVEQDPAQPATAIDANAPTPSEAPAPGSGGTQVTGDAGAGDPDLDPNTVATAESGAPNTGGPSHAEPGEVLITLAHPLPAEDARQQGLGDGEEEIPVGTTLSVVPAVARLLAESGYAAGVNPQDRKAVIAATTPAIA